MSVSTAELKLLITAQNRAQQTVEQISGTLDRVAQSIDRVGRSRGFQQAQQQLDGMGRALAPVGNAAQQAGAALDRMAARAQAAARQAQQAFQAAGQAQRAVGSGGAAGGSNNGLSNLQQQFRAAQQQAQQSSQAITQALLNIGNAARGVAGGVSGGLSAAFNGLRSLVGGLTGVSGQVDGLSRSAAGLGAASGNVNQFGLSLRNLVATGAAIIGLNSLLTSLQSAFRGFMDAAVGFNSTLENTQVAFTSLLGDSTKASAFIQQLREMAERTAFEFPDLLKMSQQLVGVGLAAENVIPLLKDVAGAMTAAGRTTADINRVSRALQQIFTTGRVQSDEMNQLAEAGIPGWRILGQAIQQTGESLESAIGRARKLGETGKISANDFFNAFQQYSRQAGWREMAENAVATFSGAMSNLRDSARFLIADAFEPLFQVLSTGIQNFSKLLMTTPVRQFALDIAATFSEIIASFAPVQEAFRAAFDFSRGGGASTIQATLDGIVAAFGTIGRQMFGAGYDLIATYAEGIISGASSLIQNAVNVVADLIASYLIGQSPPPAGPLAQIDTGGRAVGEAWVGGLAEAFRNIESVVTPVVDAFGRVGKSLSLEQVTASFRGAEGNLAGLKAAAEDAEGALRGLQDRQRDLDREQASLTGQVDAIKGGYAAQIDGLERTIATIKDQNTEAERYADLIQKQNDAITRQADLRDRMALNELKAAQIAAEGDPVRRAQLIAEQQRLKAREDDLQLAQREHDLQQRQAALDKQRAEKKKGASQIDQRDLDLAQQRINLDREQLRNQRALNGLVDREALAQIEAQRSTIERAQALRRIEEDRARATTDAVKSAAEIERAQRAILALPYEEQLEAIKREQEEQLRPLQQRLEALQQEERQLGALRAAWQGIAGDIKDAIQAQKETEKAGKTGAGAGQGFAGGPLNLDRLEIDVSAASKRVGTSMAQGIAESLRANAPALIGGALGTVLGASMFGPLGALAGGYFGSSLGTALQQRIPNIGQIVGQKIESGLTGARAYIDRLGDAWAPWAEQAGEAGDAVGAALSAVNGVLLGLQHMLQGNMPAAAEAFSAAMANAGRSVEATLRAFAGFLGVDTSAMASSGEVVAAIWENVQTRIGRAVDAIIGTVARLVGADISGAETRWDALAVVAEAARDRISGAVDGIITSVGGILGLDLSPAEGKIANLGTIFSTLRENVSREIADIQAVFASAEFNNNLQVAAEALGTAFGTLRDVGVTALRDIVGIDLTGTAEGVGKTASEVRDLADALMVLSRLAALVSLNVADVIDLFSSAGRVLDNLQQALNKSGQALHYWVRGFAALLVGDYQTALENFVKSNDFGRAAKDAFDKMLGENEAYKQRAQERRRILDQINEDTEAFLRRKHAIEDAEAAGADIDRTTFIGIPPETIEQIQREAQEAGAAVPAGFQAGVESGAAQADQAVIDWTTGTSEQIRRHWQIASPSGLAQTFGAAVTEGFALGIQSNVARVTAAVDALASVTATVLRTVQQTFDAAWQAVTTTTTAAWTTITATVETGTTTVQTLVEAAWSLIQGVTETVWTAVSSAVRTALDLILTAAQTALDALASLFSRTLDGILALFGPWGQQMVASATETVTSVLSAITSTLGDWIAAGTSLGQSFADALISTISSAANRLAETVSGLAGSAWSGVTSLFSGDVGSGGSVDPERVSQIPLSINTAGGRDDVLRQWAPVLQAIEESGGPLAKNIAAIILAENGAGQAGRAVPEGRNWFSIMSAGRKFQNGTIPSGRWASYSSDSASLADFLDLIMNNPRYAEAWQNRRGSTEDFIGGLVKGGYIVPEPGYPVGTWLQNTAAGARTYENVVGALPRAAPMGAGVQGSPGRGLAEIRQRQGEWARNARDAATICGPYLAALFSDAVGRPPTPDEARQLGQAMGVYQPGAGILAAGQFDEYATALIRQMNPGSTASVTQTAVSGAGQAGALASQALRSGAPLVGFNTPRHYFGATAFDPASGKFNTGGTGLVFGNQDPWLSPEQIAALGGGLTNVITLVGQMGESFAVMGAQAQQAEAVATEGALQQAEATAQTAASTAEAGVQTQTLTQQLMAGLSPAGAAAGTAVQQMTASIDPLLSSIAAGTLTTEQMVVQLSELAANAGLTDGPFRALTQGGTDLTGAMSTLFAAAAQVDPQFAALSATMTAADAGAQQMAVTFAEGVANATGVANAALQQMSTVIDPVVASVAAGQQEGALLEGTLVELAAATGLTTGPFRDLNNGVTDSNAALAQVIRQAASVTPEFADLAKEVEESGTVSRESALRFLQMVAALKQAPRAAEAAAQGTEEAGREAQQAAPQFVTLSDTLVQTAQDGGARYQEILSGGVRSAIESVSALAGDAQAAGQSVGGAIADGAAAGIAERREKIVDEARRAVEDAVAAMKEAAEARSPSERTRELGRNLIQGLIVGTDDETRSVVGAAADSVEQVIGGMRGQARAHSPSERTRELGWNLNEGMEVGTLEDSGYVIDAARGVVANAIDAMRDEAEARSPSRKGVQIGKDILDGLIRGLQSGNTSEAAKQMIRQYLQVAKDFSDEFAATVSISVASLQAEIAKEQQILLPATLAVADAERAVEEASRGTYDQQYALAAIGVKRAEATLRLAEIQQASLKSEIALREAQEAQEAARRGSLDSQIQQANLAARIAELASREADEAERSLAVRQRLAATEAQQDALRKGSLADRIREADITERTAQIAAVQAQTERALLPVRNQIRDIQAAIEDATRGTVEAQQAALRADTEQARRKLESLRIQDQLELAEDTGGGLSQDQINALQEQRRLLDVQAASADRQKQMRDLEAQIASAPQREQLIGLQDQERQATRAVQPLADERAALEAEAAVIRANNEARAAGLGRSIVLLADEVAQHDAISQQLADQRATIEAQTAAITARNEAAAAGFGAQIVALQAQVDAVGQQKQYWEDILASLDAQEGVITATRDLVVAGLQDELIYAREVLDSQDDHLKTLERQLEVQENLNNVLQAQIQLANALKQALTDMGIIEESSSSDGKKKKKKKKRAAGGPVLAGDVVLLGEAGPELFVPPQDGYILNNASTSRMLDAIGSVAERAPSVLRQRQVGGSVWRGRGYITGEMGVEGYAPWQPSGGVPPSPGAGQTKIVNATVHYHVHERQATGEASVERVVYEAVQFALNN